MVIRLGRRSLIAAGAVVVFLSMLAACTTSAFNGPIAPPVVARIAISQGTSNTWVATYVLPAPVTELIFARQPDDSRTRDWIPGPGYEVVSVGGVERIRRADGRLMTEAVVSVPAAYRDLPKDYAPFSPFGDGGLLLYTGRFFACPADCPSDAGWQIVLRATGRTILVDGQRHRDQATWTDAGQGRNIYVGETAPIETPDFLAVIDGALPQEIRAQLNAQLPAFMHYFAEKLGALAERPMLFASYDIRPTDGWGRQGGTLPGQVFVHFYGDAWPDRMQAPDFAADLAWHFAHEAAHLYQHQLYAAGNEAAWIHEGGAEAFAALALRAQGSANYTDTRVAESAAACTKRLGGHSVHEALTEGDFEIAYLCGLAINFALDAELRRIAPKSDGLFTVWNTFRAAAGDRTPTEDDFIAAVASAGSSSTANRLRAMVDTSSPSFDFAIGSPSAGGAQW